MEGEFFCLVLFLVIVVLPGRGYSTIKDISKENTSHVWGKRTTEQLGKNIGGDEREV